jgi:hypothetical protein
MNDLADEVKSSFEKSRDDVVGDHPGAAVIPTQGDELAPGFTAMRGYYEERLLIIMRRGYRQYAGSVLPTDGDELLTLTATYLQAPMIAVSLGAFADGVMLGHRNDHLVKMMFHFNNVDHLWHDDTFRESSMRMAKGFADDKQVCEYFNTYIDGALAHMAHATGFAHSEVRPHKVWDVWLLCGTACVTASFLAGTRMGTSWRERDVLDGIEIASESAREDGTDQRTDEGDQGELGS